MSSAFSSKYFSHFSFALKNSFPVPNFVFISDNNFLNVVRYANHDRDGLMKPLINWIFVSILVFSSLNNILYSFVKCLPESLTVFSYSCLLASDVFFMASTISENLVSTVPAPVTSLCKTYKTFFKKSSNAIFNSLCITSVNGCLV